MCGLYVKNQEQIAMDVGKANVLDRLLMMMKQISLRKRERTS